MDEVERAVDEGAYPSEVGRAARAGRVEVVRRVVRPRMDEGGLSPAYVFRVAKEAAEDEPEEAMEVMARALNAEGDGFLGLRYRAPGVDVRVRVMDPFHAKATELTGDTLGLRMWEAELVLTEVLSHRPELVRGRSVLELGAGTGLAGIAAKQLGAASVVLTDMLPAALTNLASIVKLNFPLPRPRPEDVTVKRLSWASSLPEETILLENVDVVLAADCVYDPNDAPVFAVALSHALQRPGTIGIVATSVRNLSTFDVMREELARKGLPPPAEIDVRATPAYFRTRTCHMMTREWDRATIRVFMWGASL